MNDQIKKPFPVDWLRQTSPYINTHRGKTFVVWFDGEMLCQPQFTALIHDLTLLSHLGIRLVLVHGMRVQIDRQLTLNQILPDFGPETEKNYPRLRITNSNALPSVRNASAEVRCQLESAFSTGLPNSPMSGAQITLASGNFIIAKPYGVRDGIDYQHTGEIRKIRVQKINALLGANMVVALAPIGYSPTGEMFNLLSEDVATQAAIALGADKLIFLHQDTDAIQALGEVREISASVPLTSSQLHSKSTDALASVIERALRACRNGVNRSHIVDASQDDALLKELFTRDGSGLLIDSGDYDNIRSADTNSVAGIAGLIKPLIADGTLLHRSEQELERGIQNFYIIEREGSVICCASLNVHNQLAELGCLAVHPDFRDSGKASDMLNYLIKIARQHRCRKLFAFSTRSGDWFQEQGFKPDHIDNLHNVRPIEQSRGSKLYTLDLQYE